MFTARHLGTARLLHVAAELSWSSSNYESLLKYCVRNQNVPTFKMHLLYYAYCIHVFFWRLCCTMICATSMLAVRLLNYEAWCCFRGRIVPPKLAVGLLLEALNPAPASCPPKVLNIIIEEWGDVNMFLLFIVFGFWCAFGVVEFGSFIIFWWIDSKAFLLIYS